jgi:hypothetical protein
MYTIGVEGGREIRVIRLGSTHRRRRRDCGCCCDLVGYPGPRWGWASGQVVSAGELGRPGLDVPRG